MPNVARKVIQCDLNGKEIRCFESAVEASGNMHGKSPSTIHKAINYGLTAYGYRWKYEGAELSIRGDATPGKRRKVVALDLVTREETTYESLSEAARQTQVRVTAIEASLQTGCKAKGYRFRYEGSDYVWPSRSKPFRKKVVVIDDDGNIAMEFGSAYECASSLGVIPAAVYRCLNPKNPDAKCKGYRLRYKDR